MMANLSTTNVPPSPSGPWVPIGTTPPDRIFPFHTFLMKVASRCNLDCDYCYMYRMPDQSWIRRPRFMESSVLQMAVHRIREHVETHKIPHINIVFHGGEPLLLGPDRFRDAIRLIQGELASTCEIDFGLQTNGILLSEEYLKLFLENKVRLSLSLDGSREINDLHRIHSDGSGSYAEVEKGLELLVNPKWRSLWGGILAVIDLNTDALSAYQHLASFKTPSLDFLMPDGNYSHTPPGKAHDHESTPYADWLIPVFEEWYANSDGQPVIRMFEQLVEMSLGAPSTLESLGLGEVSIVVIETDGEIEAVDSLKSTFAGAPSLGLSVIANSFDEALKHPAIYSRHLGLAALSPTCQSCRLVSICGGGYQPHRYSHEKGFLNPSVYCRDLIKLIDHIRGRVHRDLKRAKGSN